MKTSDVLGADAAARVLALILSADGAVGERVLGSLGELGAFDALGVSRERFIELADDCIGTCAAGLGERSWLSDEDMTQIDAVLEAVVEPDDRIRVCRWAAAAMEDDGRVTHAACLVLEHVLARWHVEQATLSEANRNGCAQRWEASRRGGSTKVE